MDKAYCGVATRRLAEECGLEPVVSPKSNAKKPWRYDAELYKRRNEVERLFCRGKRFRRVATRCDKLDTIFLDFLLFAFIIDFLFLCRHDLNMVHRSTDYGLG